MALNVNAGNLPKPEVQAIGVNDLPQLAAVDVAQCNADLAVLARRVFNVGGLALRFVRANEAHPSSAALEPAALCLALEFAGVPLIATVSTAWANSVAQSAGLALDQLAPDSLDLLCQLRLSPVLPAGLILRQASLGQASAAAASLGLQALGRWDGVHAATGEASSHSLRLWAAEGFALQAFIRAFEPFVREVLPSPLAALPIALPLVAARWQVPADDLLDLGVGDVLVLSS